MDLTGETERVEGIIDHVKRIQVDIDRVFNERNALQLEVDELREAAEGLVEENDDLQNEVDELRRGAEGDFVWKWDKIPSASMIRELVRRRDLVVVDGQKRKNEVLSDYDLRSKSKRYKLRVRK